MIPWADPRPGLMALRAEIEAAVGRVIASGRYILGPEVEAFEAEFAAYLGLPHVIGVGSGTDALCLALRALDIGPGDEVITVANTALATVAAIRMAGATPVLVDIEPDYWTIDPVAVAAAIGPRTRAIIAVHLYGQMCDMPAILALARQHNLRVIEDCAQAAGARLGASAAGALGDIACYSFYPTKTLAALGDGGAIATRDADLAARLRRLRQYGWDSGRVAQEPGVNSRLDEIQAAILRLRLCRLDADNDRRRALAARYSAGLRGSGLDLPAIRPGSSHVFHLYVCAVAGAAVRDGFRRALEAAGVGTGIHYPLPIHREPGYAAAIRARNLAVTEALAGRIVSLPLYPELGDGVDSVLAAIHRVLAPAESASAGTVF